MDYYEEIEIAVALELCTVLSIVTISFLRRRQFYTVYGWMPQSFYCITKSFLCFPRELV